MSHFENCNYCPCMQTQYSHSPILLKSSLPLPECMLHLSVGGRPGGLLQGDLQGLLLPLPRDKLLMPEGVFLNLRHQFCSFRLSFQCSFLCWTKQVTNSHYIPPYHLGSHTLVWSCRSSPGYPSLSLPISEGVKKSRQFRWAETLFQVKLQESPSREQVKQLPELVPHYVPLVKGTTFSTFCMFRGGAWD